MAVMVSPVTVSFLLDRVARWLVPGVVPREALQVSCVVLYGVGAARGVHDGGVRGGAHDEVPAGR